MLHAKTVGKPPSKHHHKIDYIADLNGLISGVALYPQLIKILVTHHAGDLSLTTFIIVFTTNIIWFAYGVHRKALPVLIASALNLSASGIIISLFYLYR